MATLRPLPLVALAGALLFSAVSQAQQALPAARIVNPIDDNQLVTLKGNINPHANAKNDQGRVSDSLPMAGLTLLLSRTPEQQADFDAYVQSEYETGSPNYHRWLSPAQIGQLYGPSQADIAAISAWLAGKGFVVSNVALDRMSISFTGTAGQVTGAFHTEIHHLSVNGTQHIANMSDPQIPESIAPVVSGLKGLHNFLPHPLHHDGALVQFNKSAGKWQLPTVAPTKSASGKTGAPTPATRLHPQFGINSPAADGYSAYLEEDVTPYDFATIYNVKPLWTASTPINGTGQTIAIDGTSDITLGDVTSYRSAFGLPAGLAVVEAKGVNGIDPGICTDETGADACGIGDLEENTLDVEVSGGVATGAQIVLVTSGYNSQTNPTNDPIYDGAQFIVQNHNNTSSSDANIKAIEGASILSLSYGECELFVGQSSNVAYYNLWQTAAAEGISVFVATGDSGSPSCDDGQDYQGNPYSAQLGLSVNGLASTPFNTAVGGTDFEWCKPTITDSNGDLGGCPTTSASASPYWNSTNNTTTGESATGYVPETPWNDTCESPIWSNYLLTFVNQLAGAGLSSSSNPDAVCNWLENNWYQDVYLPYYEQYGEQIVLASYIDTVGGSGGESNCIVNTGDSDPNNPTCTSASTVTTASGNVTLSNDGWPSPSWQANSGVTGTSSLKARAIPDLSFFAGDGSLDSATLICVSQLGSCLTSATIASNPVTFEPTAQEVGGTSVATPEMAGVMALINQKANGPQGLPNRQLYALAKNENYAQCSAETVKNTSSCYFQSIDQGTIAMPCSLGASGGEGGALYEGGGVYEVPSQTYTGLVSPNCAGLNSGDVIGTLVSSGTTPGYNATAGYNMATGLGSMNVANVVNGWSTDSGTATATLAVTLTPTGAISATTALKVAVIVSGASGTPTGTITVAGAGYSGNGTLASGAVTVTIPAGSLAPGSDTLTITYGGDSTYATASKQETVTVSAAVPTVTVSAPPNGNTLNAVMVNIAVAGPLSGATPTGTVTLSSGSYSSTVATLASDGTASITIPPNSLSAGVDVLTVKYSGDTTYAGAQGTTSITMTSTPLLAATVAVTPSTTTGLETASTFNVTINVTGTGGIPTGTVTLTSGSYTSTATMLAAGSAVITINGCSTSNTNCLGAGTDTLTASYVGDSVYAPATGTASVVIAQSTYTLTAAAASPASVSPGSSATSTITGTSTTGYAGVVTVSTCAVTSSPANAVNLPTCTATGSLTYAGGSTDTATGTATATVITYANSSAMLGTHPFKLIYGAGGTVLAFLVFLGIPARRKSWRALLGAIVLLAGLGTFSACGGGNNGGGGGTNTATSPGSYTFTVTGTGNDPATIEQTTTFTLTVN